MSIQTTPPTKIFLTSSTKISLHDRFTKLAKTRNQTEKVQVKPVGVSNLNPSARASARNRRLALQMASRPSVQAALKIKRRSIKQRIGAYYKNKFGNIKTKMQSMNNLSARLAIGIDPSRISMNRNAFVKRKSFEASLKIIKQGNIRKDFQILNSKRINKNQTKNNFIKRVGNGGGLGLKNRLKSRRYFSNKVQGPGFNVPKYNPNYQRRRDLNSVNRNKNETQQHQVKTKEGLDMDLEKYMAKTKSHLDADLDVYMAQSNSNV